MKADEIITYCLDNYGYLDYTQTPYGHKLFYNQQNIRVFVLSIQEFDSDDDNFSDLNHPDKYRLSLCLTNDEYNKLFSKQCPYDKKYICFHECDYTATNIIMPHPVKSRENFIQCISPSKIIFEKVLKELISLSYKRARQEYLLKKQNNM